MKQWLITCAAILASAIVIPARPGYGQSGCEIPFRSDGHMIIVKASAGRTNGLRFMIDTAATGSLVDRKVIKALGMNPLSGKSEVVALGHATSSNRFSIPMLRIGSVYATLLCYEADLSGLGVDGILGLDFLREQKGLRSCGTDEVIQGGSLTIDFEKRELRFGVRPLLEHNIPLEDRSPEIIVETNIQGHSLRLAVDTGSYTIILYKESQMSWLDHRWTFDGPGFYRLGGVGQGRQVILHNLRLENSRWTDLSGIAVNLAGQAKDGLLPITRLGLKIVHFDFESNMMSWNK